MNKNEAETRYELIDPVLRDKGYRVPYIKLETPAPAEPIGLKGQRRKGPGKTDYLLCVEVPNGPRPLPIAVLEAKKESEDPLKGMQQAKGYADCDRFDAKYVFSTNGHLYAKYNRFTGEQTGPTPFANFPDPANLSACYAKHMGFTLSDPASSLLFLLPILSKNAFSTNQLDWTVRRRGCRIGAGERQSAWIIRAARLVPSRS